MRRVLLLFLPVVSTIVLALTPITLQIGDIAVNYYEEHLDLFDETAEYDESLLLSVIDGDVFTVVRHETQNLIEVIRLTGIDAPDSKHPEEVIAQFGLESSRFAKIMLENRRVFLSYDTMTRDSYGRYFAYVWIPASYEGETHYVLFNLLSVANGYARVYSRHPTLYKK